MKAQTPKKTPAPKIEIGPDDIATMTGEHAHMSQFAEATITHNGHQYRTAEHAFQAAKATNEEDRKKIADASTPAKAKRAGRHIALRAGWDGIKNDIMKEIIRSKYTNNPEMRAALKATGQRRIIEGNTWNDRYWGACKGTGHNNLGRIIMEIREEIAQEAILNRLREIGAAGLPKAK